METKNKITYSKLTYIVINFTMNNNLKIYVCTNSLYKKYLNFIHYKLNFRHNVMQPFNDNMLRNMHIALSFKAYN